MTGLFEDAMMRDLNIAHYCANGSASHSTDMHSGYNSVHRCLTFSNTSHVHTFISPHIWGANWKPGTERELEISSVYGQLRYILATSINTSWQKSCVRCCYPRGNRSHPSYIDFLSWKIFLYFKPGPEIHTLFWIAPVPRESVNAKQLSWLNGQTGAAGQHGILHSQAGIHKGSEFIFVSC